MADKYISAEELTLSLRDDPDLNAESFARVKRHIEAAPDMVKCGHWKKNWCDNNMIGHEYEECSVCGCSMIDTNQFWDCNYCPNCGADMRGVEDGK